VTELALFPVFIRTITQKEDCLLVRKRGWTSWQEYLYSP